MADFTISIEQNPRETILERIRGSLRDYNEARVGTHPREQLAMLASDVHGDLLGGMVGWLQWGWLFIDWAWVAEGSRRTGIGSALLSTFEEAALDRGVKRARLNTASFQAALQFYVRNGYRIFAETDITAPDESQHTDYFLRKELAR